MALINKTASTSSTPHRKYHVFLSFRGRDTRRGFTDHLYEELKGRALNAFRDDPKLIRGTIIDEKLKLAIEQSRFAIVIISENYASSAWCLLELAHIVRCMKESGRIMPIFYDVDPGDVRRQTGSFAEHFTMHEEKFGKDAVREWRNAFSMLGKLAGWNSTDYRSETALIKEIVDVVWGKIHSTFTGSGSTQNSVGLDGKQRRIDLLMNPDANDVRVIGIWGTDEIGIKTTADLVYNKFSDQFEVSSFLRDIRKVSKSRSLVFLQTQLVKELNGGRSEPVSDVYEGKMLTKKYVSNKKALRILDDVDQYDQIFILRGETEWYGNGSRIIITSMDRELLANNGIQEPYLVEGLNKDEALKLYS